MTLMIKRLGLYSLNEADDIKKTLIEETYLARMKDLICNRQSIDVL